MPIDTWPRVLPSAHPRTHLRAVSAVLCGSVIAGRSGLDEAFGFCLPIPQDEVQCAVLFAMLERERANVFCVKTTVENGVVGAPPP